MANTKIPSELIADSSITAAKLADGTITTADIADSNVTTAKIADSNVTTAKIGDAQVTTAKITDANVTTGKIADDAVTTAKMASNSVTSDTIASGITLAGNTTFSGNIAVSGTVDGIDIAARDAVLTSTTTTAGAALPKAGGSLTGALDITAGGNQLTLSRSGFDNILLGTGTVNGQVGFHITNSTDSVVPFSMHENAPAATLVIDSSGNLLVGKTSASIGTVGCELRNDGYILGVNDGDAPLFLNRLSSDGDIAKFYKDGTAVGSIGTIAGYLTTGTSDTGVLFHSGEDNIQPWNVGTNAGRDNAISLGASNAKFKDLYLSGTISSGEITTTAPQFKYVSNTDSNVGLLIRDETYVANEADITASRLASGSSLTLGLAGQAGINAYINGVNRFSINASGNATFSGTISSSVITSSGAVSAEDNIYLTDAGTIRGKLQLNTSDRDNVELVANSLGSTMVFKTASTQALLLDASQNATFAGTINSGAIAISNSNPPTTNTFHGDMFVGPSLYIANYSSGANQQSVFGNNTYYNGGYKAITGDTLGAYMNVAQGAFTFNTAPTVSANAAQTFTAKMKLDGEGNLFLNTESAMDSCFASFNDHSNGEAFVGISAKNDNNVGIRLGVGTTRKYIMYRDGSNALRFYNNAESKETFKIGGSNEGNYLIAQSNSQVRLVLGSTGNATNNTSNWIRGTGNELGLNTGGGIMGFEIGGTEAFRIRTDGGLQFPDNHTFIATSNVAGGTAYEWGAIRRPAGSDGGQLSIRQYSSGDTAAGYPALAGGTSGWDENTGVYFPAVDQVGFTAGGNPTLTVEAGKQIQRMANGFTNSNGMYRTCLGGFGHATTYNPGSSGTGSYMHFKTNVAKNNKMFRFEYRGYGYNANNIDTSICGYTYESTSYVYSPVIQDTGDTTCNFKTPYYSSDSKLVLVIQITNNYTGGVMWAQFVGSHHIAGVAITSTKFSSSATGAY